MNMDMQLCRDLRGAADRLAERKRGMDEYVTLMRRAADAIESLDLRWEEAEDRACGLSHLLDTYEDSERLMDENVMLMAENEKLREERDMYRDLVGMMDHPDANVALSRENAKLRELVSYMHCCYVRGHDWGPYGALEKEHVEQTMRELGIEVER